MISLGQFLLYGVVVEFLQPQELLVQLLLDAAVGSVSVKVVHLGGVLLKVVELPGVDVVAVEMNEFIAVGADSVVAAWSMFWTNASIWP